jgi:hypothetical protein
MVHVKIKNILNIYGAEGENTWEHKNSTAHVNLAHTADHRHVLSLRCSIRLMIIYHNFGKYFYTIFIAGAPK